MSMPKLTSPFLFGGGQSTTWHKKDADQESNADQKVREIPAEQPGLRRVKNMPCRVCGAKTKARGWFDPARHEVVVAVDAEVCHYEAVVNRIRAGLKAALEVAT